MHSLQSPRSFTTTATIVAALAATAPHPGCSAPPVTHLDPRFEWFGDNRERIDAMLDDLAAAPAERRVAVLDWDNTVIKNDVGDAMMFWMLRHDKVLQPVDWSATSGMLTAGGVAALTGACEGLANAGQPLPTSSLKGVKCADEIVGIYTGGITSGGEPAFAGWNHRTMEPSYAWTVQLLAGYTPDELRMFAAAAIDEGLAADEGAEQTVGSTAGLAAYLRVYEPMQDLITTLQANGIDVWILSASSQLVVETFAARVGVAAERVVGVRSTIDGAGRTTTDLQGCGGVADGENSLITYLEGKRCWMNKVIFSVAGAAAEKVQTHPALRPVFAAGDSNTDVAFLQDATGLRLVLNRNKAELMCNAYADVGGNWLVNPMFIGPRPQLAEGYACSSDGCVDVDGSARPCRDERGGSLPDQDDTVFCANGVYCTE